MFFPIKTTSLISFIAQLFSISAVFASGIPSSNQTIDFYNDLTFIHKTLSESHPGVYNTLDARFIEEMEKNFKVAKEKLFSADGIQEKVKIMREFGFSFDDAHLWISYNFNKAETPVTLSKTNLFGIQELQKNIYWVKIPTFKPSKGEVKVFQKIIKILPKLRKKTVIIDLRGNCGGNTLWGDKILEALFGKKYLRHQLEKPNNKVYSEWRVSKGNIAHIEECITGIKEQFGKNCTWIPRLNDTCKGMKDALLRGEKYYINPADQAQIVLSSDAISSFRGRIVIIIDKYCGSASLIFIDCLKTMEADMVFVGESTGAASLYSELRTVPLPSGKGMLGFPIKVHRNRLRGNNVPYVPDIPYNSDLQNTAELQRFILDLLHKPNRY